MTIRPYEAADHQACIAMFKSNLPLFFDPSELADFERWLQGRDQGILAYKTSIVEQYYVIQTADGIVGCGGFYIPAAEPTGNLCWGMVDNAFHLKGFGRALLVHRLQEIATAYPQYSCKMDTSQHTFPFFEKLGFVVVKVTPNGYGDGLDRYDMIRPASF